MIKNETPKGGSESANISPPPQLKKFDDAMASEDNVDASARGEKLHKTPSPPVKEVPAPPSEKLKVDASSGARRSTLDIATSENKIAKPASGGAAEIHGKNTAVGSDAGAQSASPSADTTAKGDARAGKTQAQSSAQDNNTQTDTTEKNISNKVDGAIERFVTTDSTEVTQALSGGAELSDEDFSKARQSVENFQQNPASLRPNNITVAQQGDPKDPRIKVDDVLPEGVDGGFDEKSNTALIGVNAANVGGARLDAAVSEEVIGESLASKVAADTGLVFKGDAGERIGSVIDGASADEAIKNESAGDITTTARINGEVVGGVSARELPGPASVFNELMRQNPIGNAIDAAGGNKAQNDIGRSSKPLTAQYGRSSAFDGADPDFVTAFKSKSQERDQDFINKFNDNTRGKNGERITRGEWDQLRNAISNDIIATFSDQGNGYANYLQENGINLANDTDFGRYPESKNGSFSSGFRAFAKEALHFLGDVDHAHALSILAAPHSLGRIGSNFVKHFGEEAFGKVLEQVAKSGDTLLHSIRDQLDPALNVLSDPSRVKKISEQALDAVGNIANAGNLDKFGGNSKDGIQIRESIPSNNDESKFEIDENFQKAQALFNNDVVRGGALQLAEILSGNDDASSAFKESVFGKIDEKEARFLSDQGEKLSDLLSVDGEVSEESLRQFFNGFEDGLNVGFYGDQTESGLDGFFNPVKNIIGFRTGFLDAISQDSPLKHQSVADIVVEELAHAFAYNAGIDNTSLRGGAVDSGRAASNFVREYASSGEIPSFEFVRTENRANETDIINLGGDQVSARFTYGSDNFEKTAIKFGASATADGDFLGAGIDLYMDGNFRQAFKNLVNGDFQVRLSVNQGFGGDAGFSKYGISGSLTNFGSLTFDLENAKLANVGLTYFLDAAANLSVNGGIAAFIADAADYGDVSALIGEAQEAAPESFADTEFDFDLLSDEPLPEWIIPELPTAPSEAGATATTVEEIPVGFNGGGLGKLGGSASGTLDAGITFGWDTGQLKKHAKGAGKVVPNSVSFWGDVDASFGLDLGLGRYGGNKLGASLRADFYRLGFFGWSGKGLNAPTILSRIPSP